MTGWAVAWIVQVLAAVAGTGKDTAMAAIAASAAKSRRTGTRSVVIQYPVSGVPVLVTDVPVCGPGHAAGVNDIHPVRGGAGSIGTT